MIDPHRRLLHPMYRARIEAPRARDPLPETPSTPGRRTSVLSLVTPPAPPRVSEVSPVGTTGVPVGVPVGTSGQVPVGIPVSGSLRIARRLPTIDAVELDASAPDEDEWAHMTMSRSQMCPVVRRVKMGDLAKKTG